MVAGKAQKEQRVIFMLLFLKNLLAGLKIRQSKKECVSRGTYLAFP
ncbi:MAG TPA: hypothetical protein PK580_07905 [Nitrosomonas halophila]|nr:hypothetical protein [Nitrosomonas halophila]